MEASHRVDQLQAENDELKAKLVEAKVKAKEKATLSLSTMEEILYRCWDFNQDGKFSFMQPELWDPYLAKFKIRFSQGPLETE